MEWIIRRFEQPSTWRGIILLATALGVSLSSEMQEAILTLGLAAVGLINVVRDERKATQKVAARVASDVAESVAEATAKSTVASAPMPWQTPGEAAAYRAGREASNSNQPKE